MRSWSIPARVLFAALAPAAAIAIVLAIYFAHVRIADLETALTERGQAIASQLAPASEYAVAAGDIDRLQSLVAAVLREPDVAAVSITGASGGSLLRIEDDDYQPDRARILTFKASIIHDEASHMGWLEREAAAADPAVARSIGWVSVDLSHASTTRRQMEVILNIVAITALGLMLAGAFAYFTGQGVLHPILQLKQTVSRIRDGRLDTRADIQAGPELNSLKADINDMASSLEAAQQDLQERIDAATAELRDALTGMELQSQELEVARQQAIEASRIKSEFLANISHEIRTPMNAITGFANLLEKSELTEEQKEHALTIKQASRSLLTVIEDILDFSRLSTGDIDLEDISFDLRDVVDDALQGIASDAYDKRLDLILFFYSDVPRRLRGDPARIRQLLTSLIANAIKFTLRGSISVRVMLEDESENDARVRVSLQDTGIGLSPEEQRRLFHAFTQADTSATREFGGIGLGLAMCKKLAEHMGGNIGFESQVRKGSNFWFTFQARRQTARSAESPDPTIDSLRGFSCILFDPSRLSRLATFHQLSAWGLEVREAETHDELLDELGEASASGACADLVVIGLGVHNQTAKTLQQVAATAIQSAAPMVILASTSDRADLRRFTDSGATVALPRSVPERVLHEALTSILLGEQNAEYPGSITDSDSDARLDNCTIMVVDDNAINRRLVTRLLKDHGAEVVEAENGQQAVERFKEQAFDLVLMDIHMPIMSGIQATERIRDIEHGAKRTPVVALTARVISGERERLVRHGLDDFLIKPIQESEIWAMARKWIGRGPLSHLWQPEPRGQPTGAQALISERDQAIRIAGGNRELADELFQMLINELPVMKERLNNAYLSTDLGELEAEAHKIYGAASYCAAQSIAVAAGELERAVICRNEDAIDAHLEQLNRDVDSLLAKHGL